MYLKEIKLINFRNYKNRTFVFEKKINLVKGENGKGKSNLIEAIFLITNLKSFKASSNIELVNFNQHYAQIEASIEDEEKNTKNFIIKLQEDKKKVTVNNKLINKSTEILGKFSAVLMMEEDIDLIKRSPNLRRRYIDNLMAKEEKRYLEDIIKLKNVVKNKNKLLKNRETGGILLVYNEIIKEVSKKIADKRREYLQYVENRINFYLEQFKNVSNIKEIEIRYTEKELNEARYEEEIRYRESIYGAHRDDYFFYEKNNNIKTFNSYGEKRIIAILLKIAEINYLEEKHQRKPVLLIDDAYNGLDDKKNEIIKKIIYSKDNQIIETSSDMQINNKKINEIIL